MEEIILKNFLEQKSMFLINMVLVIITTHLLQNFKIILPKLHLLLFLTYVVLTMVKMVIRPVGVLLREELKVVEKALGESRKFLLTLKDLRKYGYQKIHLFVREMQCKDKGVSAL